MDNIYPINYLLVKLAARCNLNCTYCYWFTDDEVYNKPSILTPETEKALLIKIEEHIRKYNLRHFSILFHGGEPLLFGKKRFDKFARDLKDLSEQTGCKISLSMTTNGTLIDQEWIKIIKHYKVSITISIDGPKTIHDSRRVDLLGNGSFNKVVRAVEMLQAQDIEPGVLAVCDPESEPEIVTDYFVNTLKLKHFDILVPDATHERKPQPISGYYKKLFDLWFDNYSNHGVDIRYVHSITKSVLGIDPRVESIGYGPIQTVTILTDGSIEPLDVLRIANSGSTKTEISIHTHTFQDVCKNSVWKEALHASLNLPKTCKICEYQYACGGGYLPHRWSKNNRYDNPSVYCNDLKDIFNHVWNRVATEINVTSNLNKVSLLEASK